MLSIMLLIRSTLQPRTKLYAYKTNDTTYGPLAHTKTGFGISTPILFPNVCRPLIVLIFFVHSVSSEYYVLPNTSWIISFFLSLSFDLHFNSYAHNNMDVYSCRTIPLVSGTATVSVKPVH